MSSAPSPQAQVIQAPARPAITGSPSIFLAGTTSTAGIGDWRAAVIDAVSHRPVTIFNPMPLHGWAAVGPEDAAHASFRTQVAWELDMQGRADVVLVYFGPHTDAPISLLELGLCVGQGRTPLVACHPEYRKRGNVQMVCERAGIPVCDSVDELVRLLMLRIEDFGKEKES